MPNQPQISEHFLIMPDNSDFEELGIYQIMN